MFKVLIDTCVWLDLAKDSDQLPLLTILEELNQKEELTLLVPETVLTEFKNNKDKIVKEGGKSLSSGFKRVKEAIDKFGDPKQKMVVLEQLSNVDHKIPTFGDAILSSIKRIEILLKRGEILPLDDIIRFSASQRAIDKKAPFHKNKNNFNDAIIIETYNQYIHEKRNIGFRFAFITHNKHDFSDPNGNEKFPHPDFKPYFSKTKSFYFIKLSEALQRIKPHLISEMMIEQEILFEPRTFTEMLQWQDELTSKVWYNRHQYRVWQIEKGKIKIIERKDFSVKTSQKTIVKDIWEGAKKSAMKLEKKYGKENLGPWTDFEWGMINGKLSALRWVMGEDWDELDT